MEELREGDKETETKKGKRREMAAVMWLDRQKERENIQKSGDYLCLFSLGTNGKIWTVVVGAKLI